MSTWRRRVNYIFIFINRAPPYVNDSQWDNILPFLERGFREGTIAVAPRGVNNEWNLHFRDETYPAMARLIENFILYANVNPNKVYLVGFSAGGDGAYQMAERIPHLLAGISPQGGHPNGVSTINQCNLPMYLAVGEKDAAYKRNKVMGEHYNNIIGNRQKYGGPYLAKCEVVSNSPHSFQCWIKPRKGYFNNDKNIVVTNDTAFDFLYANQRIPYPTEINLDTNIFRTPLRNHFSKRGNFFYFIEIGDKSTELIRLKINYQNCSIQVFEGNNFRIWINSKVFGNEIIAVNGNKIRLNKNNNLAKENMKLFCDPYYAFDSFIDVGSFN